MSQLNRTACWLKRFFTVLLFATPVLYLLAWLQYPVPLLGDDHLAFAIMPHVKLIGPVPMHHLLIAIGISCIPLSLALGVIWHLRHVFKHYQHHITFTLPTTQHLKSAAIFLLLSECISPFYQALMSALLTWHNPPGHRLIMISLKTHDLYSLLVAITLLLLTWIFQEGHRLQEEQQLTV